jgi:hypothetical protein
MPSGNRHGLADQTLEKGWILTHAFTVFPNLRHHRIDGAGSFIVENSP